MSKSIRYKDLPDKYKPDKVLMPDGTLAYPSDNTLIKVDEEGKPLDYSKLAKGNYAEVNEDGSYTAVKQLPEITVTFAPKKRFIEKVNDAITGFVNDNILMNKDNIRGKNMEKALSTESGRRTINNFREGQDIAAKTITTAVTTPYMLGTLLSNPATVIGSYVGGEVVDTGSKAITGKTWTENVAEKTGLHPILASLTNPGSWYGGAKGIHIDKNELAKKFIKGDAELGWSNLLNLKNHWLFKGGASPTNIITATTNRIMPFLNSVEKTPLRVAAYQFGKRSKGNASLTFKDILKNPATYTGSVVEGEGKNLLAMYLFKNDPIVKHTKWLKNISSDFKPVSKRFFAKGEKPEPGRTYYKMSTAIPEGNHIIFSSKEDLLKYNTVGKPSTKQMGFVVPTSKGYAVMPGNNVNPIGALDDIGNHGTVLRFNSKGQLEQKSWDNWDFDIHLPLNYMADNLKKFILTTKEAALMRNAGTHNFTLGTHHPVMIGNKKIYNSLNKIPIYRLNPNSRIGATVLQQGGTIVPLIYNYTTDMPEIEFSSDIDFFGNILDQNLINTPKSVEYLSVPVELKDDIKGSDEFEDAFDEVQSQYPEAAYYRDILTKIAQQESGFNPTAKNPNAPAYGYFQFMEGDKWSNISTYAGTDIQTFLNNPKLQIKAAIRLAKSFENSFSKEDIKQAAKLGYGRDSLIAGAWLAGAGGVKKFIWKGINVDDKHWSPEGAGVDLKSIMDKYA